MSDHMKKVQPGDSLKIPARAYNAFIDAARAHRDHQRNTEQRPGASRRQASGIVMVRNDSGGDKDQYAVLGIDAPIIDPDENEQAFSERVALSCVTPSLPEHAHNFVVLAEPIPDGKIGLAYAAGVCPVKVNVPDENEDRSYATVGNGVAARLGASPIGRPDAAAEILWREGGTGEQWAIVRLGATPPGQSVLFGRTTSAFTRGAGMTLDRCDAAGDDNGLPNITVQANRDQAFYTMANSTSIPTGTVIPYALADDGEYYMLGHFIEVVTDYRVDGATRKFQKKTRNVWVLTTGTESGWVDVHTGDACPT